MKLGVYSAYLTVLEAFTRMESRYSAWKLSFKMGEKKIQARSWWLSDKVRGGGCQLGLVYYFSRTGSSHMGNYVETLTQPGSVALYLNALI